MIIGHPSISEILNKRISYQPNAWSSLSKEMTIIEALNEIKSEKHQRQVTFLRDLLNNGDKEGYNSHKKNLPAVTFCGTFSNERKKANLNCYNSVIVLDVDKLKKEALILTKKYFLKDPLIFAFWESPSQEGIKGLVYLNFSYELNEGNIDNSHKGGFQQLSHYFRNKYSIELDCSGSDTTRLCFFSFDKNLVLKNDLVGFKVDERDLLHIIEIKEKKKTLRVDHHSYRDALFNPKGRNNPPDRYIIQAIIKFLIKKKLSITNSYDQWYKVAMAIANSFTYEIGVKYFLKLSILDSDKFNESNCKNFLINCYEYRNGAITFGTIIYLANEIGYITKKQRERGTEAASSQVSSSNSVFHLPEDLKK